MHYRGGEAKSIKSDFQWTAISHLPPICSWLAEKWSNLNLLGHAEMGAKVLSMCCTQLSLISSSFSEVSGLQQFSIAQQCLWLCIVASCLLSWCQRWGKQLFGEKREPLDLNFYLVCCKIQRKTKLVFSCNAARKISLRNPSLLWNMRWKSKCFPFTWLMFHTVLETFHCLTLIFSGYFHICLKAIPSSNGPSSLFLSWNNNNKI